MVVTRRGFVALAGTALTAGCVDTLAGGGAAPAGSGRGTTTSRSADTSAAGTPSVSEVSLLLNWKPSGLHVPYYAAAEHGFYREEGIHIETIEAGQGSDFSAKQAALGNTTFGITSSDQVLNVDSRDLSPLSVGVLMQQSPVVVFTTRETFGGELDSPDQLAGATIGTGPGMVRVLTELYLEQSGVRSEVDVVDTGFDTVQQLLAGKVDAAGGVFGDAISAAAQGYETDSLRVATEVPAYGHVVATERSFAEDHPETVAAFLRGTARGAAWARNNVDAALDALVSSNGALAESRAQQREKWVTLADSHMLSETVRSNGWGWSAAEPWQVTADALRSADQLGGSVDAASVWTNEYLDTESQYITDYADRVSN